MNSLSCITKYVHVFDKYFSGDQYIGEWYQGHKHGKGVLRFANGISQCIIFYDCITLST